MPMFGILIPKALFAMGADPTTEEYRPNINWEIMWMFFIACIAFICTFSGKHFFSIVGQNITINVRKSLYGSILTKHMGWHDLRQNSSAIMTVLLAKDVDKLDAVASEAFAI
jgi:ABC-type multidrug transport system fused ATPase/permease subunit